MKYKFDKKYIGYGVTSFLVLCGSLLFSYILYNNKIISVGISRFFMISMPIIYGLVFAYLLTPVINFIEYKIMFPILIKIKLMKEVPPGKKTKIYSY